MQKLALLTACLFAGLLAMGQRTEKDPAASKAAVADLSISSVTVAYSGVAAVPTRSTAHGTEQGNPNLATAHPITQCTVVVREDLSDNDNVVLVVTLPFGVKVQQKPANATTSPGPNLNVPSDGAIHIPIGHLNAGQSVNLQLTYSTPGSTTVINEVSASAKGDKFESNQTNNTRSAILH